MFQFLQPNILFLLIPIIVLVIFLYFQTKKSLNFWWLQDIFHIYNSGSFSYKIYYILIFLIFSISIWVIAQPVIKNTEEKIKKNGIDIMLVLDVSFSMTAEDLKPNRLDAAKEIIDNFLKKLKNDRVWFVVFAWKPFTSLPLNFDYKISQKILNNTTVDSINQRVSWLQWTAIWDALIFAGDNFNESEREKIIILLTDGTANAWVDPEISVSFLNQKYKWDNKIKIYTIWIWKNEETFISIKNVMWFTQKVAIEWVDEETLKQIAKLSNWKYYRAENKESLREIFDNISELEKTDIEIDSITEIKAISKYFIYLLLLIFTIYMLYKIRKKI